MGLAWRVMTNSSPFCNWNFIWPPNESDFAFANFIQTVLLIFGSSRTSKWFARDAFEMWNLVTNLMNWICCCFSNLVYFQHNWNSDSCSVSHYNGFAGIYMIEMFSNSNMSLNENQLIHFLCVHDSKMKSSEMDTFFLSDVAFCDSSP